MTNSPPPLPATTPLIAPSCGDSPLSQTASIISILTFALGLLASYIAFQSATRGAPSEIARLVEDLRSTQHEINRVAEYIFDDAHRHLALQAVTARFVGEQRPAYALDESRAAGSDGQGARESGSGRGGELYEETQALLGNCVRLFYEADGLLKRSVEDAGRWHPEGVWRRVVYVMNRHEVEEKMKRLGDQKAKLAAVQMNLFIRKSAVQDAMLEQMVERVKELQGGWARRDESDDSGVHVQEDGSTKESSTP